MAAISLSIEMIHQSFAGIVSAIRSDELSRRELITYVEQIQTLFLQEEDAEKSALITQSLQDVAQGKVERFSHSDAFEFSQENLDTLLKQSLSDVASGKVTRYGK